MTPSSIDFALVLLATVLMAVEVCLFAGLSRAVRSGVPRQSRLPAYVYLLVYQWLLVGCVLALWIENRRAWSLLLLGSPHRWQFAVSLAVAGAFLVVVHMQRRNSLRRPEFEQTARSQVAQVEAIVPRSALERRLWTFVAITAGCCEEILFRGFLFAFFASFAGSVMAVLTTVVLFGLFHGYYGWRGILRTALFGFLLTLMALWSGSLIPVIIIHAAVDLATGDLAYRVLSQSGPITPNSEILVDHA